MICTVNYAEALVRPAEDERTLRAAVDAIPGPESASFTSSGRNPTITSPAPPCGNRRLPQHDDVTATDLYPARGQLPWQKVHRGRSDPRRAALEWVTVGASQVLTTALSESQKTGVDVATMLRTADRFDFARAHEPEPDEELWGLMKRWDARKANPDSQ